MDGDGRFKRHYGGYAEPVPKEPKEMGGSFAPPPAPAHVRPKSMMGLYGGGYAGTKHGSALDPREELAGVLAGASGGRGGGDAAHRHMAAPAPPSLGSGRRQARFEAEMPERFSLASGLELPSSVPVLPSLREFENLLGDYLPMVLSWWAGTDARTAGPAAGAAGVTGGAGGSGVGAVSAESPVPESPIGDDGSDDGSLSAGTPAPAPSAGSIAGTPVSVAASTSSAVAGAAARARSSRTPVMEFHPPHELLQRLDLDLPDAPDEGDVIRNVVQQTLRYSVRTRHPMFMSKLYSGPSPIGVLADMLTTLLNTNAHTFTAAPAFVLMELTLLTELRRMLGMPARMAGRDEATGKAITPLGDGVMCPGGSYANLLAMLVARERAAPGLMQRGAAAAARPLVAFASRQTHYSIKTAAGALGLGSDNVVGVPCDSRGRMIPAELERCMREAIAAGRQPFFVCSTAGTTVTGAFDDFRAIRAAIDRVLADYAAGAITVAGESGGADAGAGGESDALAEAPSSAPAPPPLRVWMHVDGSWGGSVIMSDTHRSLLDGVDLADSFVCNPHKMLGVPLQCSCLVTRHNNALRGPCAVAAPYLFHTSAQDDPQFDVGYNSMQCGRHVDSLKLFLTWRYYGRRGMGERVDIALANAQRLAQRVREDPRRRFRMAIEPAQCANVCFFWLPPAVRHEEDLSPYYDYLHAIIPPAHRRLMERGSVLIDYNPLNDQGLPNFWRPILHHPDLTGEDLDFVLEEVDAACTAAMRDVPAHIASVIAAGASVGAGALTSAAKAAPICDEVDEATAGAAALGALSLEERDAMEAAKVKVPVATAAAASSRRLAAATAPLDEATGAR